MKMYRIYVQGMTVSVCESCVQGHHESYGTRHLDFDTEERGGCKNISDDGQKQCACHGAWTELQEAIKHLPTLLSKEE